MSFIFSLPTLIISMSMLFKIILNDVSNVVSIFMIKFMLPTSLTKKNRQRLLNQDSTPSSKSKQDSKSMSITIEKSLKSTAIVVPIFKKGAHNLPRNYRPILLTCVMCRMLKQILAINLMTHLHSNNLLSPL